MAFPSAAYAEWVHKVDLTASLDTFGYRAAKIVSADGYGQFDASGQKAGGEVRGRFQILGKYLHFDLEPYTVVPDKVLMVNLGGIEARILAPSFFWKDRIRVGYYHHSSHNFTDPSLGFGIVLDGIDADVRVWEDEFETDGKKGDYQVHVNGTYFLGKRASPYLMSGTVNMPASDVGLTSWRLNVDAEVWHPIFRVEGGLRLLADGSHIPASLLLHAAASFKFLPSFAGDLSDHLLMGPYFSYGRNFSRISEFGDGSFVAGIQIVILVSENHKSPLR
jgi:hypothetical protein